MIRRNPRAYALYPRGSQAFATPRPSTINTTSDDGMLEVRVEEHRVRPMIRCSVWTNATWCGASARWSRAPTTGCLGLHQQTPRAKQLRLETEIIVFQAERRHAE